MRGHFRTADGCRLAFEVEGQGPPVLWQHGLGATAAQPAEVFPPNTAQGGFQRVTLICRGHEGSDLGAPDRLSIAQFTADAVALLDHLGLPSVTAGGISLGAAIALRLAVLHPERLTGLILARPAWVDQPAPLTLHAYVEVARLLQRHGEAGGPLFQASQTYRDLHAAAPDNAASLASFFARPRPETTVALLSRIPLDGPGVSLAQIQALALPTLVLVTADDVVHPQVYGAGLASLIPNVTLTRLTPKGRDKPAHVADFRAALAGFLA